MQQNQWIKWPGQAWRESSDGLTRHRPGWRSRRSWRAGLLALAALASGCANPVRSIFEASRQFGFRPLELAGGGFRLMAFSNRATDSSSPLLHVYLDGDGTPWLSRYRVSSDPTPRDPVMLKLMALDQNPSLYLGRPCYLGHAADPGCSPILWTSRRYAPEIVASLAEALDRFIRARGYTRVALFGHSGGGALALLLAARIPETFAVVTLAGNLDPAAWTAYHRYSPLLGSLNPAEVKLRGIDEYHYLGALDSTIPAAVFQPIAAARSHRRVEVLAGFDHGCCWQNSWTDILRRLQATESGGAVAESSDTPRNGDETRFAGKPE